MNQNRRFVIDKNMRFIFAFLHLNEVKVLQKAGLPIDFFDRKVQSLSSEQYYDLWTAIVENSKTVEPIPLMLEKLPLFAGISAPIMAALCSQDFSTFVYRIKEYKPLIGPLALIIEENNEFFSMEIANIDQGKKLHPLIVASEMIFFVKIIRYSTKQNIVPSKLETIKPMGNDKYTDYFGMMPQIGDKNRITFKKNDACLPFTMSDDTVWDRLEPELKKRLEELEIDSTFSAKVRSVLMELMPMGKCSTDNVADKLCISSRTLQRKLKNEDTNYQQQLNHTRELLAKHYLSTSEMSISEITFLLGFEELSSFSRAFSIWTGLSPESYRISICNS